MITIRKITEADTDNILKWRNSKHVMDVFIDRNLLTKEIHTNWLNNYVKTGKVAQYIIHDEDDDKDVGSVYLKDIDYKNKKAEFGIFIGDENSIGKGIGVQAAKQLLDIGFNELGLNKIFARILQYNQASYKMFMKLGFKQDALMRDDVIIDEEAISVYIVSMLKEEWNNYEM